MPLALKIALRYLKSKKTHNAVNIISIISVLGVVVTTAALVCVLSVFNGFRSVIESRLSKLDPVIAVQPAQGKVIGDADSVIRVVKQVPGVAQAVPVVEDNALAVFLDYQMVVRLKGVPDGYNRLTGLDSIMVDGEFKLQDPVSRYAVLGPGPAVQLKARPGFLSMVHLYAPQRVGRINLNDPMSAFTEDSLFVSGVFQAQQKAVDADLIYVPLSVARGLFDYDTQASQVELGLQPGASVEAVLGELQQRLGPAFVVKDRIMQQAESFRLVNMEKWITFLLLGFIMVIATFNVISTLSLLIIEKDASISTLRSMGATNRLITRIFIAEGWLIALLGAISGVVLGLLLCLGQQHFGWIKLGGDASQLIIRAYPVQVVWTDVLVVFLLVAAVGLATSLVTSLIMRRRLSRADRS